LSRAATAQITPFYEGKTIRIIVGLPAGDVYDLWARLIAKHMTKHIPGNPNIIVQNMPGAASMITANYVYSVGKSDGLTFGMPLPSLYFDQLLGRKEIRFDWAKFAWIGSPVKGDHQLYMRADAPYKSIEDVRTASLPPRCGSTGTGSPSYYIPKLLEELLGAKFVVVTGYQGGQEIDLAVERGEIQCRAFTIEAFFAREPFHTWRKKGFVRVLVQTGRARDAKLAAVPTIYELMDKYRTSEKGRRLASVVLLGGSLGRPLIGSPGISAERVKMLRAAYARTLTDSEFLAEVEKRKYELDPTPGEELENIAKALVDQPPEVIDGLRKLLAGK
jgi:tripartite-type tricarboxylate transporter receptor subunit TctC